MERIDVPSFWEFKGAGDYTDQKLLMSSPFPVTTIIILYLWFVLKFGPEFMRQRKPYNVEKLLVVYNNLQVAVSFYIFYLGYQFMSKYGMWNKKCLCEKDETKILILDGSHYYFVAKVVELMDTIFFVLRKNQRQVTFLHVYHHTMMVLVTWSVVKYSRTDGTVFLGTINSFVHIIMYGYYCLSVFPRITKYLWWKKYITAMQLVQFVMMFLHIIINHVSSECQPAHGLLFVVCFNTVLFLYLFGDFYIKSYLKNNAKQIINAGKSMNDKGAINYGKMTVKMQ
ncbi:elongation of very long chain fatty acids protein 7-like [Bombyx mandarina]|uniref:Elongation of very long chain fatty acids protein n=1 Tax=Bombyx mandarina TaxID=7092 RepID=A0A6J2JHP6_BOMMA|nr:elongation of very long chain fatty acids protein 7-like [Bombyx mandarina]